MRFAIVDFTGKAGSHAKLAAIAAAVTKQAQQHVAQPVPHGYGVSGTVRVASGAHDVLTWEVAIGLFEHADQPGALGYHDQTPSGLPLIKVFPFLDPDGLLSVTISHEVVETLVDPNGARASQWSDGKFYAYEACDAVEADSYTIDGVAVSNFCLPSFFEPMARPGKLDWMGLCVAPLEVRPGGYGQWFDPAAGWQQQQHPEQAPRAYRLAVSGRGAKRRAAPAIARPVSPGANP